MTHDDSVRGSDGNVRAASSSGLRSLLVPIDLTTASDRVLDRIPLLPIAEDATLTLMHVLPGTVQTGDRSSAEREAFACLAAEVRGLRAALPKGVHVMSHVRLGTPASEIASSASETNADLIVMGCGGGHHLRDAFFGSTAERVIRHSKLPVLAVRRRAHEIYTRPAVALDLDMPTRHVIALMHRVLAPTSRVVDVIHAFDIPFLGATYASLPQTDVDSRIERRRISATAQLEELLAEGLDGANIPANSALLWRMHVRFGSAWTVVADVTKEASSDLLTLSTHAYSGAAYAFLGTVAGDLLRSVESDVLVVPTVPPPR